MTGAAKPCQHAVKPDKTILPQELASPIRLFEQRQFSMSAMCGRNSERNPISITTIQAGSDA